MKHRILIAALATASAASASAQNTGAILTDGPHELAYGATVVGATATAPTNLPTSSNIASAVNMNFRVGTPPVRQLRSGNWHYRITGDSRERNLHSAVGRTLNGSNEVEWRFANVDGPGAAPVAGLGARMGFKLNGQGPLAAAVTTWLCFDNFTGQDLTIDVFLALDFDLAGTPTGDVIDPILPTANGYKWRMTDGTTTGAILMDPATGAGAGTGSAILGSLTDNAVSNFGSLPGAGGLPAGSWAHVIQRQVIVPNGQIMCTPAYFGVGIEGVEPVVPEPASLVALGAGLVALARRRRR